MARRADSEVQGIITAMPLPPTPVQVMSGGGSWYSHCREPQRRREDLGHTGGRRGPKPPGSDNAYGALADNDEEDEDEDGG